MEVFFQLFLKKITISFLNVTSNNDLLEQCGGSALLGGLFWRDFSSIYEKTKAVHSVIATRI